MFVFISGSKARLPTNFKLSVQHIQLSGHCIQVSICVSISSTIGWKWIQIKAIKEQATYRQENYKQTFLGKFQFAVICKNSWMFKFDLTGDQQNHLLLVDCRVSVVVIQQDEGITQASRHKLLSAKLITDLANSTHLQTPHCHNL